MPTYEYLCKKCEHNFEQVQKMSDDSLTICPSCGEPSLQRVINATAFHLKGSGWYKTDYASEKTPQSSSSSGDEKSSSDKSSTEKTSLDKSSTESTSTKSEPSASSKTPSSD